MVDLLFVVKLRYIQEYYDWWTGLDLKTVSPLLIALVTTIGTVVVAIITSRKSQNAQIQKGLFEIEKARAELRLDQAKYEITRLERLLRQHNIPPDEA